MVRIAVKVRSGTARFRLVVQAESIDRALEIAKKQDLEGNCEVTMPTKPEAVFVAEPAATTGPAGGRRRKPMGRDFYPFTPVC